MSARGTGPRYRLHEPLGEGGMGVVHLGTLVSAAGERRIAIKRLARRDDVGEEARARLVAEARLVFQLTHANIVQVLDLGDNAAGTFVIMEYVRGRDLRALVQRLEAAGERLAPAVAVYIAREVARALDYAHRLRVVHGDVTPGNILLSVEGEVKLADFGIARALGASAPGDGVIGGTPGFMAPEATTGTHDHRADIYSLGVTLIRALGGRHVPAGRPVLAALDGVDLPADLREILARATAPHAAQRYLSAADLEAALAGWLARRHPGFTPSALARLILEHGRDRHEASTDQVHTADFALETIIDRRTGDAATPTPSPQPPEKPRTATMAPRKRSPTRSIAAVVVLLAVAGAIFAVTRRAPSATAADARPIADAAPAAVATAAPAADAAAAALAEADAAPAPVAVAATATDAGPAPPSPRPSRPRRPPPSEAPPPASPGFLTVNATPWAAVHVDGRLVASETPLYRHPLAPGRHRVTVTWPDGRTSAPQLVDIVAGAQHTLGFKSQP